MLPRGYGVEVAVRARVASAWSKWHELTSLLNNESLPLKNRAQVYEACIRSVLLYGSETWPLSHKLFEILRACDRKMLRYMARVKWSDKISSSDVAKMCGLRELEEKVRRSRLRWFGHVKRAGETCLGRIVSINVDGRRPIGRPRRTWGDCIREDLQTAGISEELAKNRSECRRAINCPIPGLGNKGR